MEISDASPAAPPTGNCRLCANAVYGLCTLYGRIHGKDLSIVRAYARREVHKKCPLNAWNGYQASKDISYE